MLKSITAIVGQSTNAVSSSLNTLTTEQQAVKEQLVTFLKTYMPNLFSKENEEMADEFKTSIYAVEKTIDDWQNK